MFRCAVALLSVTCITGCARLASTTRPISEFSASPAMQPVIGGLESPVHIDTISADCPVPLGWRIEPPKAGSGENHKIWLSPTGKTAYGVIHFNLPLPIGTDPVLWVFMSEMRRHEGTATLLSKQWDPNLKGLRFVAQGGLYTVRTNLVLRGFDGWAVYAGTLTAESVVDDELRLAEQARELTRVGHASHQ